MNNYEKVFARRQLLGKAVGLSGLAITGGVSPTFAQEKPPGAKRRVALDEKILAANPKLDRRFRASEARCRFRPRLEVLEDRTLLAVNVLQHYTGLNFSQSTGYIPPDPSGAAGTTNYIETVNQTIAIYTPKTTGAVAVTDSFSDFWFTQGHVSRPDTSSFLTDPNVVWDEQIQRFIIGDCDVDTGATSRMHVSRFDLAVSTTASPATLTGMDWKFYSINTTESGFDADYPGNCGWNHDAFVFTLRMFATSGSSFHDQVNAVSIGDLAAGAAAPAAFQKDYPMDSFAASNLRPTVMHDSVAGDPMWLISEYTPGLRAKISVVKMTNVLSNSPTFSKTYLGVNAYSDEAIPPLQPDGSAITTRSNINSRILKAAEYHNIIVATHSVSVSSTEDDARWYRIDVSGPTPSIVDQGNVSGGNHTYIIFPGIDINSNGDIGMSYMQSGNDTSTDFLSMYVTGRMSTDAKGKMGASVLVQAGVKNYHDFGMRAGDFSGISVDGDGTFWAANEFADNEPNDPKQFQANWGTAVAHFSLGTNPAPATNLVLSLPSGAVAGTSFSVTVTARDQFNNIATNYTGTVHFMSSDGAVTLPADYTLTAADAGVHSFTNGIILRSAGSQSVTVTDTANGSLQAGGSVLVSPAAASALTLTGLPAGVIAGTASTVTVIALDPFNNIATSYTGTVTFTSTDGQAGLPDAYTFTAADGGVHTFTNAVTMRTAGSQTVTAGDALAGISGSATVLVTTAPADHFILTAPAQVMAGVAFDLTVTALDAYGNTDANYQGTVTFSSSDTDPGVVLPADYPFTTGVGMDNGQHLFPGGATLITPGDQIITATDTITLSTGTVTVTVIAPAPPPVRGDDPGAGRGDTASWFAVNRFSVGAPQIASPNDRIAVVAGEVTRCDQVRMGFFMLDGLENRQAEAGRELQSPTRSTSVGIEKAIDQIFADGYGLLSEMPDEN